MFENMKIEINSEQPLDEVVKELERLGYLRALWDEDLVVNFVETYSYGLFSNYSKDHEPIMKNTTLAQLKQMEN